MEKHSFMLEILTILEYLIPIVFLAFTHFIDEKVHKIWRLVNYHPSKTIRLINRYQWELGFLVISLLAILGITVAHRPEPELYDAGLFIFFIAIVLIGFLLYKTIAILDNDKDKMSPFIFYLSIFIYVFYITTAIYFKEPSEKKLFTLSGYSVPKWYIFLIALFISTAIFLIARKFIESKLPPETLSEDIEHNISIYKNKYTKIVKRQEALYYIINYYYENKNQGKMEEWLNVGANEFPSKTQSISEVLGLNRRH